MQQFVQVGALEGVLEGPAQVHVALGDLGGGIARRTEALLHGVGPEPLHRGIPLGVDREALRVAEGEEPPLVEGKAVVGEAHEVGGPIGEGVGAVGGESHHLAFVAVAAVADELASHRVQEAEGVGEMGTVGDLDPVARAAGTHRADEVAGSVDAGGGARLPRRAEVRRRDVGHVVLDIRRRELERAGVDAEFAGDGLLQGSEGATAEQHLAEGDQLAGAGEGGANFPAGVGARIAPYRDELHVGHAHAAHAQALVDREPRKARVVLAAVEALLGDRRDGATVDHQGGGGAGVEGVDAEDDSHCGEGRAARGGAGQGERPAGGGRSWTSTLLPGSGATAGKVNFGLLGTIFDRCTLREGRFASASRMAHEPRDRRNHNRCLEHAPVTADFDFQVL